MIAAQEHQTQVTLVLAMTPSFYADAPSLPRIVSARVKPAR